MNRPESNTGIRFALKALRGLSLAAIVLVFSTMSARGVSAEETLREVGSPPSAKLVVYCFHGQFRCFTCLKMEEYARETLEGNFADDLWSGAIVLRVVNLAMPENQHFISDFRLDSWTVVISREEGGKETRYRNLAGMRGLVKDRRAFIRTLFREIELFLGRG